METFNFSHLTKIFTSYQPKDKNENKHNPRIAIISNHYNESFHIKHWLDYYTKELGSTNCIIVDHSSTENFRQLIHNYDIGIINLPRNFLDEIQMADFISCLATSLLKFYDIIIHTDIDEIIIPSPNKYNGLVDYFSKNEHNTYTCVGLNVVNEIYQENPYNNEIPLFDQRQYVRFFSPMCKTVAIRQPVHWSPGYHGLNLEINFHDYNLFMFHMREMDFTHRLDRLGQQRKYKRSHPEMNLRNQQISNQQLFNEFLAMTTWPKSADFNQVIEHANFIQNNLSKQDTFNVVNMDYFPQTLYKIPDYFKSPF